MQSHKNRHPRQNYPTQRRIDAKENHNRNTDAHRQSSEVIIKTIQNIFEAARHTIRPLHQRAHKLITEKVERMFVQIFKAIIGNFLHARGIKRRHAVKRRAPKGKLHQRHRRHAHKNGH